MSKIKAGIIGVGSCAKSLVEGVQYYNENPEDKIGLMYEDIGGYSVHDIEFVIGFDIDKRKVNKKLAKALRAQPNCAMDHVDKITTTSNSSAVNKDAMVYSAPEMDGIAPHMHDYPDEVTFVNGAVPAESFERSVELLQYHDVDVLINYLPVGSEEASKWYAEQVLQAGCGFINCIPVFIASGENDYWQNRFREAGAPIIGDDIKSQVGATITHRVLTRLFMDRGVEMLRTYQLNFGGNTDFMNMLDRDRLDSKKISKTQSVTSQLDEFIPDRDVHVGPSDYVPWLTDRKWCYIRMEGKSFGDVPLNIELKMEVWDSPNSAGVVIDAIRCAKIAKDRGLGGPVVAPSSYFMKSPPVQYTDDEARELLEDFIAGEETAQG